LLSTTSAPASRAPWHSPITQPPLRLSEKLGYRTDGANTFARRGVAATEVRLVLEEPSRFVRPDWTLQVDGLDGCRQMLGVL
jgi:hypothetical protein